MTSPRTLLTAWNIKAKKQLGQNFLTDPKIARAIVEAADITKAEVVLEIGPGLGAITTFAAIHARKVIAVEKDQRIIDLLKTELVAKGIDNVDVLQGDILRTDLASIARQAKGRLVVLGNLPYNISSQVVVRLIQARGGVDRAVLMLQREMAQRICADPGSKDYGRLSVMLKYCARTRTLMPVGASRFFPAPKVDSTVVVIDFSAQVEDRAKDESLLFRVVKAAFGKRRKTLRNALSQSDLDLSPGSCDQLLQEARIDPMKRAEQIPVSAFVRLSNTLFHYLEDTGPFVA